MQYLEVKFYVAPEFHEILIAEMSGIGFDSFEEGEDYLGAYVLEENFKEDEVDEIIASYSGMFQASYSFKPMEDVNWNEEWEKNFNPVYVGKECYIRAHFHESDPSYKYEIVITPKMSFGTGHHSTTSLCVETLLALDLKDKKVFDCGCGTSVLAILASKMGADEVYANDIDPWPYENSLENVALNGCKNINVFQAAIDDVPKPNHLFDVVIANINKNVLLNEIPSYSKILTENGYLVLSGFYVSDIKDIEQVAQSSGLKTMSFTDKKDWACVLMKKV